MSDEQGTKKKALLDALVSVEKTLNNNVKLQNIEDYNNGSNSQQRYKIEKYKNKGSIFKRPSLPLQKCLQPKTTPNYMKNPEKYTHYSLSDVTDLSDRTNQSAAFNFLREMEQRKSNEDNDLSSSSAKIVFKNSTRLKLNDQDQNEDDKIYNKHIQRGKFMMAEYVVGNATKKRHRIERRIHSTQIAPQLKLSHLDEEDE